MGLVVAGGSNRRAGVGIGGGVIVKAVFFSHTPNLYSGTIQPTTEGVCFLLQTSRGSTIMLLARLTRCSISALRVAATYIYQRTNAYA